MIPGLRKTYNEQFTEEKYIAFLKECEQEFPGQIEFRLTETPIFIPKDFTDKVIQTCESIVDFILEPGFKEKTERSIPKNLRVPNENAYPHFIAFDFGICNEEDGSLSPQLIEMQGFPSLFCWQVAQANAYRNHFGIPDNFSNFFPPFNEESYIDLLKEVIVGKEDPENVILLEIYPKIQKTRIDFFYTEKYLGIKTVCLTELIAKENKLFYVKDGKETAINRIYNRLIFDDLEKQELPENVIDLTQNWDVNWITHPNWFYRISKFTMPFIKHPFIPQTYFLNEIKEIPADLENYVLKPLFSFAGQGVIIDLTKEDITNIKDPENWILQKKVSYAPCIPTANEPAKAEIRIFYFWPPNAERPVPAHNLARLSKGKMIGVRYNQNKDWVGGSVCFFEQLSGQDFF